jgi:release factor glutamine methyltransferase
VTGIAPGTPLDQALRAARAAFAAQNIVDPALDARILLMEATGLDATALARDPQAPIEADAATRLEGFVARRLAGEPVWRILGYREFWGLRFALAPDTLEPRPDTEALVALALRRIDRGAPRPRILDLGTGSGCILLALLSELNDAFGIGTDRAFEALIAARANARALGLGDRAAFVQADWAAPFTSGEAAGTFDLIVSNPPYIPSADIAGLATEVAGFDPRRALDGGADGLAPYRPICDAAMGLLRPGGALVLEHGHDQAEAVRGIAEAAGLVFAGSETDLAGILRAQAFSRPATRPS